MNAWAVDSRLMQLIQLITKLWEERERDYLCESVRLKVFAAMSLVIVNFLHEQRRCCYLACEKS